MRRLFTFWGKYPAALDYSEGFSSVYLRIVFNRIQELVLAVTAQPAQGSGRTTCNRIFCRH
jgi:hypothetical protein